MLALSGSRGLGGVVHLIHVLIRMGPGLIGLLLGNGLSIRIDLDVKLPNLVLQLFQDLSEGVKGLSDLGCGLLLDVLLDVGHLAVDGVELAGEVGSELLVVLVHLLLGLFHARLELAQHSLEVERSRGRSRRSARHVGCEERRENDEHSSSAKAKPKHWGTGGQGVLTARSLSKVAT